MYEDAKASSLSAAGVRFVAAGLLALLSLVDVVLTRQVLLLGGEELNPIADAFIRTPSAWALKGVAVVVIAFVTAYFMRSRWLIRASDTAGSTCSSS